MAERDRKRLREIHTFPELVKYLRDDLHWPVEHDSFEQLDLDDFTYDWEPEELGIDPKQAAKIEYIKQLQPIVNGEPQGVFFVKFDTRSLPVVALRKLLATLVIKKRATAKAAERPLWAMRDLVFISSYGESDERQLSFAYFQEPEFKEERPALKVLGWDDKDTPLHLDAVHDRLHAHLAWPKDPKALSKWRKGWSAAFREGHGQTVRTAKELAEELARLARGVKERAKQLLKLESESGPLRTLMEGFKKALIHDLTDEQFADMYAQTIAYGLLSARITHPDPVRAETLPDLIPVTNPFLKELMETFVLAGGKHRGKRKAHQIDFDELGINDVVGLLRRADMQSILENFGNEDRKEDPVTYFYEDFLNAYDKQERKRRGVYYTPKPVVSYIVRSVHQRLQTEFGIEDGLASTITWGEMAKRHKHVEIPRGVDSDSPFVQILDPATGTATFLVTIIEVIYDTLNAKWNTQKLSEAQRVAAWNEYVPKHLLPRLYGYELMMAPYAIAHLKIGLKLVETGYRFGSEERAQIYLTDSLEPASDHRSQMEFQEFSPALARESKAVSEIKKSKRFSVVVGNPPYLREKERGPGAREERIGGWVRHGARSDVGTALFDDFLAPLAVTGRGVHAKLAYELSVMFWRLAVWLVFERWPGPGIVSLISPRAYLSGPGHFGMRQFLCRLASDVEIVDLGGDNRGARKSENIFDIETGVCIGTCVKQPSLSESACQVRYVEFAGTAEEKFVALVSPPTLLNESWRPCGAAPESFLPTSESKYRNWPKLTDLFPWQHSGSQFKRLWPISEAKEILAARWKRLVSLPGSERGAAFVETRDRLVDVPPPGRGGTLRYTGIRKLPPDAPTPEILRYCYRSLDRQWCMADERLADFIRPSLLMTLSDKQVFAATLMSKQLEYGPAVTVTHCLPDMDIFCNRGAKDIIPLWRDAAGIHPNINHAALQAIQRAVGSIVTPEALFCYSVAVLASPSYAESFHEELTTPGPRIPIAQDVDLFMEGATLGARFIWLQTYGERRLLRDCCPTGMPKGKARLATPIPESPEGYPEGFEYDANVHELRVGGGCISNVEPAVYAYSQSGFKVVESWLRYRMKERGGRARRSGTRSELDEIRPARWRNTQELLELLWVIEGCVDLWPELGDFLGKVIGGSMPLVQEVPPPTAMEVAAPDAGASNRQTRLI